MQSTDAAKQPLCQQEAKTKRVLQPGLQLFHLLECVRQQWKHHYSPETLQLLKGSVCMASHVQ